MNNLISNFSDDNQINHDEKAKNSKLSFFKTKELSSEHDFPFNFKNPN